jgi:hypothetical protein
MKRYVVVAGVAVALLAIAAVEHWRMAREVAALKAARDSEVAADATRGGALLRAARARWARAALPSVGATGAVAAAEAPPPPKAPPARSAAEQIAHIDEVFAEEDTDTDWAPTTSATLEIELRKRAPSGFAFESISCRTTLCKAQVTVPDDQAYQALVDAAVSPPTLWEGALVALRNKTEGPGSHVGGGMFFARPGQDMPYLMN